MPLEPSLQTALLATLPRLRAFAYSLCGNMDHADDLVQEALLLGIANIHSFTPGTNLAAWLMTILRNAFVHEYRMRRRSVEDPEGTFAATLTSQPEQDSYVQVGELRAALAKLPLYQREAIILVGGHGLSYKEAAEICHCAIGTIKSRTKRARARLAQLLSTEHRDDLAPDSAVYAALSRDKLHWAA